MSASLNFCNRPSKIIVNLKNLEQNLKVLRSFVQTAKIMAVVKANAYGHGLIECAKHIETKHVDYFGVALVEEGEALRQAGIKKPIHVFGGILGEQISRYIKADLELTASSIDKLIVIEKTAEELKIKAKVHLKIDTGMGRIGVRPESAAGLIDFAKNLANVTVIGIFSHFACSDDDLSFSEQQLQSFIPIVKLAKAKLGSQIIAHISNSAGILNMPHANLDMVRPGILLYGVAPSFLLKNKLDLKPVLNIESKIVFFKIVYKGSSVSYGRSWIAQRNERVVTVPIGYGDGYTRSLSNKAKVIINGKLYPIIGKICMDQLMVNIGQDSAFNQDSVTLIGSQGEVAIQVEDLAEIAQTVPHEILSNLNLRMSRIYVR